MSRGGGARPILALVLVLGLAVLGLAVGAWFLARPSAPERPEPPSALVVVLWPGLRAGDLGALDAAHKSTPHLASLAGTGLVAGAYVPSSESSAAALATLLTGLEPTVHGLGSVRTPGRHGLPDGIPTLAEGLAARGWRTLAALLPAHLAAEWTGLARGFDTRFGEDAADPLEPFLAELAAALRSERNVLALLCEAPTAETPAPRGRAAIEAVRRALVPFRERPEIAQRLARLELSPALSPAPGADAALGELDELLLRRRGDPAREALLGAYRAAALSVLDERMGRVVNELSRARPRSWAVVVTGLGAPTLRELEALAGEHAALPEALRVPLVLGGVPGLASAARAGTLRRDLDLAALLARAAEGPFEGAPIPWRAWDPAPRSDAVVQGAELLSAAVWLADTTPDPTAPGAGRLVLDDSVQGLLEEPWAARARELARGGGRYGVLEFHARGLAGREALVRSLHPRAPLRLGADPAGSARVVVRFGLHGDRPIHVPCERRATPLRVRLPLADFGRIWIGGRPLPEVDLPLLPSPDGAPWPADRPAVVAVDELGGGRLAVRVDVPAEASVRLVLELLGPDPYAELPPLAGDAPPASSAHPRRPSARVIEARGPFDFEVLPPLRASLALVAFVDGVRVPASELRFGERAFAGEHIELAFSAFAWSDTALLGPADPTRLAEPGLALSLSDPPPRGALRALTLAQRVAVERLPEHE